MLSSNYTKIIEILQIIILIQLNLLLPVSKL